MLRRSFTQSPESYYHLNPSQVKKSNPYLLKLEAMKQACKPGTAKTSKNGSWRKSSSQSQQIDMKESLDSPSKLSTAYRYGKSSELSSPYFGKKNKQIQYSLTSSCKLATRQWAEEPDCFNHELPQSTIVHLSQFIDYYLQNSLIKAEWNRNSELQMQRNPIELLVSQIEVSKSELQKQKNNYAQIKDGRIQSEQQIKDQIQQLEDENDRVNIQILQMINSHTEHRSLLKTISTLQKQISETKIKESLKLQEAEALIRAKLQAHTQQNSAIMANIEKSQNQIRLIMRLRENIKNISQETLVSKKGRDQLQGIYKQLILQKSAKDIKEELASSVRLEGTLLSNKQILDNFYKSIDMKQQIIKNVVITHSESHQFSTSLELKQAQQGQLNLTSSRNCLTQDQTNFLSLNKSQFDVYEAYLKTDSQVKKTEAHLDILYQKYERTLNQMAVEVENMKKLAMDQLKKMRELENIEAIRQAEIQQLNEILNAKKQQLSKIKNEKNSFEIFRNSLAGFGSLNKV